MGVEENSEKVYHFANKLDIPVVGGSDTHHQLQYGCIINELDKDCNTVSDLKDIILSGNYTIRISENLPEKVQKAVEQKAIEKKIMETATIN